MRLVSCYIDGFGRLRDTELRFCEGINTFNRENGWGKSTFAAFIRVMLYGFEGETKRNDFENERKRYKPWDGGVYGGELVLEVNGRRYRIQKTFGAKKSGDTFALYDDETHALSTDYSDMPGEEIFGLDSRSFARAMYVGQSDCVTEATDGINAKLGNITQSMDDMRSYEKAREKLKNVVNGMSPSKKTGELYKRKRELAEIKECVRAAGGIEDRIAGLQEERNRLQALEEQDSSYRHLLREKSRAASYFGRVIPDEEELAHVTDTARELERMSARLEAVMMTDEERTEYESLMDRYGGRDDEDAKQLEKRLAGSYRELSESSDDEQRPGSRGAGAAFIITAVMCALLAAGSYMKVFPWGARPSSLWLVFAAASLLCIAATCVFMKKAGISAAAQAEKGDMLRRMSEDMKRLVGLRSKLDRERRIYDKCCELNELVEGYISECGLKPGEDVLSQLLDMQARLEDYRARCEELDELAKKTGAGDGHPVADRLAECDRELVRLRNEITERSELAGEADELAETLDEELCRYELVTKTYGLLETAKQSFVARYNAPVMEAFARCYECITGECADSFMLDADMRLSRRECGMYRDTAVLSEGTKDIAGICLRLAFVDAMYKKEQPMLVLDDIFVNLDDRHMAGAERLLKELSERYQIIYFTCSGRRAFWES